MLGPDLEGAIHGQFLKGTHGGRGSKEARPSLIIVEGRVPMASSQWIDR